MKSCKPVSIPKNAFAFCRYTLAVMLWVAFIFKIKILVTVAFIILVVSYILKVEKSPLVFFYTHTIEKIFNGNTEIVDENGIRFAHGFGAIFSFVCLVLLYYINDTAGWICTLFLCLAKTSGAFGFCSALKLYGCMSNGNCCRVGKLVKNKC